MTLRPVGVSAYSAHVGARILVDGLEGGRILVDALDVVREVATHVEDGVALGARVGPGSGGGWLGGEGRLAAGKGGDWGRGLPVGGSA